ncbi:MAG: hypothetical protein HY901_29705 [Deltaproteobacteria bacterium]|nr:hypothetical protein [Deltaproteobacteria bacterium]
MVAAPLLLLLAAAIATCSEEGAGLITAADACPRLDAQAAVDAESASDAGTALSDAGDGSSDAGDPPADAASPPDAACLGCSAYARASSRGRTPEVLAETSGLAMSAAHPGVLFAHNDSGDTAHLFAIDLEGNLLGEFVLPGVTAVDWEDMAIGPCPAGSCAFIGDIGDNLQTRTNYAVYRVPLPSVEVGKPVGRMSVTFDRLPFKYPSAAKWNAETLLVHPLTGDLYVLNKVSQGSPSTAFKFPQPLTPGVTATLSQVATLPVPKSTDSFLTGGDIHPCGNAMLLRTYNRLYEFHLDPALPFDSIFTTSDFDAVPVAVEQQGETVAYQPAGRGYVTVGEGSRVPINAYSCQ